MTMSPETLAAKEAFEAGGKALDVARTAHAASSKSEDLEEVWDEFCKASAAAEAAQAAARAAMEADPTDPEDFVMIAEVYAEEAAELAALIKESFEYLEEEAQRWADSELEAQHWAAEAEGYYRW